MNGLPTWRWQAFGVAGGLAALGLLRLVGFKAWVALLAGLAVYAALLLLLVRRRESDEVQVTQDATLADVQTALAGAEAEVDAIIAHAGGLSEARAADARRAAEVARAIVTVVRRDPARLREARAFFASHLPRLAALVGDYARLYALPKGVRDEPALAAARDALQAAAAGFEAQHRALVARDQQALAIAAETLSRMLTAEHGPEVRPRATSDTGVAS
jgi:hypothetical protein